MPMVVRMMQKSHTPSKKIEKLAASSFAFRNQARYNLFEFGFVPCVYRQVYRSGKQASLYFGIKFKPLPLNLIIALLKGDPLK